MKKIIIITLSVALVIGVALFVLQRPAINLNGETEPDNTNQEANSQTQFSEYSDAGLEFKFSYREEPDGYIVFEDNEIIHPEFMNGVRLVNRADQAELEASVDAREGPPAMHVLVYDNPENLHAPVWAMRNSQETNYGLMIGDESEAVVGGANAIQYTVDGLYPINTYVVASGGYIYVLMGAYLEKGDQIYQDFEALVDSFTFIPSTGTSDFIDLTTACNQALTYMTFPSGEEADKFLAECLAGEHPEVLTR